MCANVVTKMRENPPHSWFPSQNRGRINKSFVWSEADVKQRVDPRQARRRHESNLSFYLRFFKVQRWLLLYLIHFSVKIFIPGTENTIVSIHANKNLFVHRLQSEAPSHHQHTQLLPGDKCFRFFLKTTTGSLWGTIITWFYAARIKQDPTFSAKNEKVNRHHHVAADRNRPPVSCTSYSVLCVDRWWLWIERLLWCASDLTETCQKQDIWKSHRGGEKKNKNQTERGHGTHQNKTRYRIN